MAAVCSRVVTSGIIHGASCLCEEKGRVRRVDVGHATNIDVTRALHETCISRMQPFTVGLPAV